MTVTCRADAAGGDEAGAAAAPVIADWLHLAAAPTFALMAVLLALADLFGGGSSYICSAAPGASPLSGMVLMYLLMSVFHAGFWLKLMSRR